MNPLTEILPPNVRKYLYAAIFLAGLVVTALQTAAGDYVAAITYLIPTLTSALAASNIPESAEPEPLLDGHATYADEIPMPEDTEI